MSGSVSEEVYNSFEIGDEEKVLLKSIDVESFSNGKGVSYLWI